MWAAKLSFIVTTLLPSDGEFTINALKEERQFICGEKGGKPSMDTAHLQRSPATFAVACNMHCCCSVPTMYGQCQLSSGWRTNVVGLALQHQNIHTYTVKNKMKKRTLVVTEAVLLKEVAAVAAAAATVLYLRKLLSAGFSAAAASTTSSAANDMEAAWEGVGLPSAALTSSLGASNLENCVSGVVQMQSQNPVSRNKDASIAGVWISNNSNAVRVTVLEGGSKSMKRRAHAPSVDSSHFSGVIEPEVHQVESMIGVATAKDLVVPGRSDFSGLLTDRILSNWNADESSTNGSIIKEDPLESASHATGSRPNVEIGKIVVGSQTEHFLTKTIEVSELDSLDDTNIVDESVREKLDALLVNTDNGLHSPSLLQGDGEGIVLDKSNDFEESLNKSKYTPTAVTSEEESARINNNGSILSVRENGAVSAALSNLESSEKWWRCYSNDIEAELRKRLDDLCADRGEDPRRYTYLYNKLLYADRLQDCLNLLERMNEAGILDTKKLSHTKFFCTCKRWRAVKEAFRFLKLIVSPSLRTYNSLLSVCASAGDVDGAFQAFSSLKRAGLKADCMLYTTLISTCAKAGKVDLLFKVFHEMVNAGIEPNVYTYGALIDGCASAGQVAKAFGVNGIMRLKKVKPDRVIFNSLITACGRSGAIERAFDVLSEMKAEPIPVHPNHVTIGALIKACTQAGQADRGLEAYKMMQEEGIRGSVEVYTEAVHACSQKADLDAAFGIYNDMKKEQVQPDEVFFSALIDVAGNAKQIDAAFKILDDMKLARLKPGATVYSSLMGVCSNTRSWERAFDLYREIQKKGLSPSVSTFNALITALCDAKQLHESVKVLQEMRQAGKVPNKITYSVLLDACERADDIELAFNLYTKSTSDNVVPTADMCESIIGLCLRKVKRFSSSPTLASSLGSLHGRKSYEKWVSWALSVYRQTVTSGVVPTTRLFSKLLGCLRLPLPSYSNDLDDAAFYQYDNAKQIPLIYGFGIYDPRALALFEEAVTFGAVPCFSFMDGPITVHSELMPVYVTEVCLLKLVKALKHRHAAGARLPLMTICLPTDKKTVTLPRKIQKTIAVASCTGQAVAALLRRLRLSFQGHESSGKIRITAAAITQWLHPKQGFKLPLQHLDSGPLSASLSKGITEQQRMIRFAEAPQWSPNLDIPGSYQQYSPSQHRLGTSQVHFSSAHRTTGRRKKQDSYRNDQGLSHNGKAGYLENTATNTTARKSRP